MMTVSDQTEGAGRRSALGRMLEGRVAWLAGERRDSLGRETGAWSLVTLIGREHYIERRKSYPILGRRDLEAVLRQEVQGARTLTIVGDEADGRRTVTFYELTADAVARAGATLCLVPESLAVSRALPPGGIARVERDGFGYFVSASGISQPVGGAVATPEMFALAIGLDAPPTLTLAGDDLRSRAFDGLRRLSPGDWLRLRVPGRRPAFDVEWRPLAYLASGGLVVYLVVASAYLNLTRHAREAELAGLGPEVEQLLGAQREVDELLAQQAKIAEVVAGREHTYRVWQAVAVAWGKGAVLTGLQLTDDKLTLRGSAPVATDVLAAISATPGFGNAKFSSPVRQGSSGREEFSLEVSLGAEAGRG